MQPDKDAMSSVIGTNVLAKSVLVVLAEDGSLQSAVVEMSITAA